MIKAFANEQVEHKRVSNPKTSRLIADLYQGLASTRPFMSLRRSRCGERRRGLADAGGIVRISIYVMQSVNDPCCDFPGFVVGGLCAQCTWLVNNENTETTMK